MKIFLGNPPWRMENRLGVRAGSRWPFTIEVAEGSDRPPYVPFPFFLAYAAALLEKHGINVFLCDAIADGLTEKDFLERIIDYHPDVVVLETSTPSIDRDLSISQKLENLTSAKQVLCGAHVSVFPEEILNASSVDYIFIGEYEYTLLELAGALGKGRGLADIQGLAYRTPEGKVIVGERRPPIGHLDELPWPARHMLSMANYRDTFCGLPNPSLQMWTSRGCPYSCTFCLWPDVIYGSHGYRMRTPANVADEMEWCVKKYGFKSVYFDDDVFNIYKNHVLAVSGEIKKRKLGIVWAAMCRADHMDSQLIEEMRGSGLYAVKYGIESGSQRIVDSCGKKLNLKRAKEAIEMTRASGIKVHLAFTFGLPGETKETIEESVRFALETDPDSVQFSLTVPFPGTEYFKMGRRQGFLLTQDWSRYDGAKSAVVRTQRLTGNDLECAISEAEEKWKRHVFQRQLAMTSQNG